MRAPSFLCLTKGPRNSVVASPILDRVFVATAVATKPQDWAQPQKPSHAEQTLSRPLIRG